MMKEEAARKIEEHLQVLVDYDVLNVQVADTLTEYIWSIIGEIDPIIDVDKSWLHLVHNLDSEEEEEEEDEDEDSE
jgi:hypothetical protein